MVRPCAPGQKLMGIEASEAWVLFDRQRIIGVERGKELAATARECQDAPLSEEERKRMVARLKARERLSRCAYRGDELIRRWNLFESQISHCFLLGLPAHRLDESGTLVHVLNVEPITAPSPQSNRELRREAWAKLEAKAKRMLGSEPTIRLPDIAKDVKAYASMSLSG